MQKKVDDMALRKEQRKALLLLRLVVCLWQLTLKGSLKAQALYECGEMG